MIVAACPHESFAAQVNCIRLTDGDGVVTGYVAELHVHCDQCRRQFQFLGLEPGYDSHGAGISIDGLQASIGMVPQGHVPSPLDRLAINFPTQRRH